MNVENLNKQSQTDWNKIDQLTDQDIDLSDAPPLSDSFFENAKLRRPAKNVSNCTIPIHIDFPQWMISSLEKEAERIGVDSQAIIKMWIAQRLDRIKL